jgi:hypothetical protein
MPEPDTDLYQQKLNRIEDAVYLKKPERVPIILEFGYFVARYAGITYQDLINDPLKCAAAYRKTVADFAPDAFHCIPFDSGPALEAVDSLTVKWPGLESDPTRVINTSKASLCWPMSMTLFWRIRPFRCSFLILPWAARF